jgi:DNA-binding NtrC family response regulator
MNEVTAKPNGNGKNLASETGHGPNTPAKYSLPSPELTLRSLRDVAEVHAISNALERTGWNRKRAAQLLSISYRGLMYKIRRHNLAPPIERS